MSERHFEVRLKKSGSGSNPAQRKTLLGLGLKRFGKAVFLKDTPPVRGMIYRVVHLVDVQAKDGAPPASNRTKAKASRV